MHVYTEIGETISVLHIRVSTISVLHIRVSTISVLHIRVSTIRRSSVCHYYDVSLYDVSVRRSCVHGVIQFFGESLFFVILFYSVISCVFDQGVKLYVSEICIKFFLRPHVALGNLTTPYSLG